MSSKIRLVPRNAVSRTEVEEIAEQLGWARHRTTQRGDRVPYEITWLSPDRGAAIHWIEDHLIRVSYLLIHGSDVQPTMDCLKSLLSFHSSESIQAAFEDTRDGSALMDALHVLGVYSSGEFDPDLFALFRWAMNDPDPLIRRVSLLMASLTNWREFIPLLDYIRTSDPAESVRAQAETIFDVMSNRVGVAHDSDGTSRGEGDR